MISAGDSPLEGVEAQPTASGEPVAARIYACPDIAEPGSESFFSGLRTLSHDVRAAYMQLLRPPSLSAPTTLIPTSDETEANEAHEAEPRP